MWDQWRDLGPPLRIELGRSPPQRHRQEPSRLPPSSPCSSESQTWPSHSGDAQGPGLPLSPLAVGSSGHGGFTRVTLHAKPSAARPWRGRPFSRCPCHLRKSSGWPPMSFQTSRSRPDLGRRLALSSDDMHLPFGPRLRERTDVLSPSFTLQTPRRSLVPLLHVLSKPHLCPKGRLPGADPQVLREPGSRAQGAPLLPLLSRL